MDPNEIKGHLAMKGYNVAQVCRDVEIAHQYGSLLIRGYANNSDKCAKFWDRVSEVTGFPIEELAPHLSGSTNSAA